MCARSAEALALALVGGLGLAAAKVQALAGR